MDGRMTYDSKVGIVPVNDSALLTNYDRLISKTPEELAVFMHDMFLISTEIGLSTKWWLQWLKSPAEPLNEEVNE